MPRVESGFPGRPEIPAGSLQGVQFLRAGRGFRILGITVSREVLFVKASACAGRASAAAGGDISGRAAV